MGRRRVGIALELGWPFRRHLDVFAGTQRYGREEASWTFEIDEFIQDRLRRGRPYDGLIARATPELARAARRARVPLVNVWFNSPARDELPGVFPDLAGIGRLAAEHLAERGFRRFGCLGVTRALGDRTMAAAYHQVVRGLGCRCTCAGISQEYSSTPARWTRFQTTLDAWIGKLEPRTGLLVSPLDVTARYVVHAAQRRGLRVPEDLAVVTASNEPAIDLLLPPSLTSVELNFERLGFRAARMLDLLMGGRRLPERHEFVRPVGIIARDSTDYFAVKDGAVAAAMRFIEKNLARGIRVKDVAAAVGPRRTLERRFRETAGRSIASEIRRLRLLKAKRLLSETAMQVKQVAQESGFGDPIRLHEVFARETGLSPSEYRRKSSSAP